MEILSKIANASLLLTLIWFLQSVFDKDLHKVRVFNFPVLRIGFVLVGLGAMLSLWSEHGYHFTVLGFAVLFFWLYRFYQKNFAVKILINQGGRLALATAKTWKENVMKLDAATQGTVYHNLVFTGERMTVIEFEAFPGFRIDDHSHEGQTVWETVFIQQGAAYYVLGGKRVDVLEGESLTVEAGKDHTFGSDTGAKGFIIWVPGLK